MELKFHRNLDFQLDAIKSTIDVFKSQKLMNESYFLMPENNIVPNALNLTPNQILENVNNVQKNNFIAPINELDGMNFSIEMETGTGKTYVYLRTIFELNQNYGFKKFIVIVPSVAIREGVLKTLQITKDHFKDIYENIPYNFYEYDSKRISMIKQFSRSNNIEIMIMTIDSFNKETNIMNREDDHLRGDRPIELVNKSRPILILDEPQNLDTANAKKAISSLNPLFTLRYSATHRNYYNLIYRLTPVDAYKKNLVKKIEVRSVIEEGDFNNAFIRCLDINVSKNTVKAKLLLNKKLKSGFKATEIVVKDGDNLFEKTQNLEYEDGYIITEISKQYNFIKFLKQPKIRLGEEQGSNRKELIRIQIEQTIQEHFEKSLILKPLGIKPLSLFFIDRVDNYKSNEGIIRKFFEQSFEKLKQEYPEFAKINVTDVHSGYFSKSYKTEEKMKEDKDAFNLIMRDKERLLSFDEPVQFIFSHSALREGWDNPNVFNICTLNPTISGMRKRQEIGRGMRLPVNQEGDRVYGDQNILTIIANEHYAKYAATLQTEYEEEYGIGNSPEIHERKKRTHLKLKKGFKLNPEFKELWKRISRKTKYAVKLNTEKLINSCISDIEKKISIDSVKFNIETASFKYSDEQSKTEIKTDVIGTGKEQIETQFPIPNLIKQLTIETKLTRSTILKILTRITNLNLVFQNPQSFISSISNIIKENLEDFLVDGIEYFEMEDWYKMELFEDIRTYEDSIIPVDHSIYDGIIWDSKNERSFAKKLDDMSSVKLFIKLPRQFIIDTPIGTYNPDWAIVMNDVDLQGKIRETLYFVAETKANHSEKDLRPAERKKIECARKHFEEIKVKYDMITSADELLSKFT